MGFADGGFTAAVAAMIATNINVKPDACSASGFYFVFCLHCVFLCGKMQEIIICRSFFSLPSFFTKLLPMQTIRGLFLIVPFSIKSICSLTQLLTDWRQPLSIIEGFFFESQTLNSSSQSVDAIGIDKINMLNTESDTDDLLLRPYVLSAL